MSEKFLDVLAITLAVVSIGSILAMTIAAAVS